MSSGTDDIRAALRERRGLAKKDRSSFPEPEAVKDSKKNLMHWVLGVIVQDEPMFVALAAASVLYCSAYGAYTLLTMAVKI